MLWKRLNCVFFSLLSVLAPLSSVVAIEAGTGRIGGGSRSILWGTTDSWQSCRKWPARADAERISALRKHTPHFQED